MDRLLAKLENKNTPQFVPVRAEGYATINDCFFNVNDKIANDSGEIVYGWKLQQGSLIQEAERHAIWKSPDGELIDVTPEPLGQNRILFLVEDKGWVFDGDSVDNIRVNITDSPIVDDLILIIETITKLFNTGRRRSKSEIVIDNRAVKMIEFLKKDKIEREIFIKRGGNMESPCYCGSQNPYNVCHTYQLIELCEELLRKLNLETSNK